MKSRKNNQTRKNKLEKSLADYLNNSSLSNTLPIVDGRLSRIALREAIGCGENWLNQNSYARDLLSAWDKKLYSQEATYKQKIVPGQRDKNIDKLINQLDKLQQRNALLVTENTELRQLLKEYGWLTNRSEDEKSGRLPW